MVSPDDVDEVRRGMERLAEEKKRSVASSSHLRFGVSMTLSGVVLVVLVALVLSGNLAMAGVTISDVGGFHAQIDRVEGDGVTFYPVAGESSACRDTRTGDYPDPQPGEEALPMLRADIDGASIGQYQNVEFRKDVHLPEIVDMAGIRVSLTRPTGFGNEVTLGDASIEFTRLDAEEIDLQTDLVIDDRHGGGQTFGDPPEFDFQEPGGEFVFEGQDAYIEDAEAVVHYLSFSNLTLPALEMNVEYVENEANLDYAEPVDCPVAGAAVLVTIADTNEPVDPGETLDVTVDVVNPSASESTFSTVYLDFNDTGDVDSEFVSLSGGESDSFTLQHDTAGEPRGEHEITVRSDDDEQSDTVLVGDPAYFDVNVTDTDSPVGRNDQLQVNASVENTGDVAATQDVQLYIDGALRDSTNLQLEPGETSPETFVWETADDQRIDNYTATVESDDDSDSTEVEVVFQDAYFEVDVTDYDGTVAEGEAANVSFTVENVGTQTDSQNVTLEIREDDGQTVVEEAADYTGNFSLAPGENYSDTLTWQTENGTGGASYAMVVGSDDDFETRAVQVTTDAAERQVLVVGSTADHRTEIVTALENHLDNSSFVIDDTFPSTALDDANATAQTYDAVMVNDFGDETNASVQALYDEVDADTAVISLENWGGGSDAVTRRAEVLGDPDIPSDSFSGNPPIQMDISQSHPIFEDPNQVGTSGDTVDVYETGGSGDRAWFTGFTGGTVLADVDSSDDDGGGPGAAVTGDDNEALLSLGYTGYVDNYTTGGEQILANSIEFTTDETVSAQILSFDVPLSPGPYQTNETVQAEVNVENTGDSLQTFFVDLRVEGPDGVVRDNDNTTGDAVTLTAGQADTVTLEWDVEDSSYSDGEAPAGSYDAYTSVWQESNRPVSTELDSSNVTDAFEVESNVSLPLRTEQDFQALFGTYDDTSGGNVVYDIDTTASSVENASGRFQTQGTSDAGYGEVVVPDVDLTGEDWLSFDYDADTLQSGFGEAEVYVGGDLVWSTAEDTTTWESVSVDVSGYTGEQNVSLRLASPDGTGVSGRTVHYDDVRLTNTSAVTLPLSTEQDFTNLGSTFSDESSGNVQYTVDTTTSVVDGASANFTTAGNSGAGYGAATAGANFTGEDWLTFEYNADSLTSGFGEAEVYVDGDLVWSTDTDSDGWETKSIDVSGYTGTLNVSFRLASPDGTGVSGRTVHYDDIRFTDEARELMTPFRTQQDFQDLGDSFEDPGSDVNYTVDTTNYAVEGASGQLCTAGTSGSSYGQVSWDQDLTNQDTLVFNATGTSLDSTWAAAQIYVDGTLEWERESDFGWEHQVVDVSGYTGENTIEFRLDARGTGLNDRCWNFDDVELLEGSLDATIANVDWDGFQSYSAGQGTYGANVTVENTGGVESDFFVGFSAIDPSGTERDNGGTTGGFTGSLAPGEQETVRVDLSIESDFETGLYDAVTAVWTEDPDLVDGEQIESTTNADAFEVALSTPFRTQADFQNLGETFEDPGSDVNYTVDTTDYQVEGAAGSLSTAGTSGSSYGQVSWEQDLSGYDTLGFLAQGTNLDASWAAAQVYVNGNLEWEREEAFDWSRQNVDVSGYTGENTIEFRLDARGTSVSGRGWSFDDIWLASSSTVSSTPTAPSPDTGFEHIDVFELGNVVSADTTADAGYSDNTSEVVAVKPGDPLWMNVTIDGADAGAAIWIDSGGTGTFSGTNGADDRVWSIARDSSLPTTYTTRITIPTDISQGPTTLRVATEYQTNGTDIDPESITTWGEAQDYTVYVPP